MLRPALQVTVDEWLRDKMLSLEVPGLNSSWLFFYNFLQISYPAVTVLLEYLNCKFATGSCILLYNPVSFFVYGLVKALWDK